MPKIIGTIEGVNYIELTENEITALVNNPTPNNGVHWKTIQGRSQMLLGGVVATYALVSDLVDFLTQSDIEVLVEAAERSYAEKYATALSGIQINGVDYVLEDIPNKTIEEIATFNDAVIDAINAYLHSTNAVATDANSKAVQALVDALAATNAAAAADNKAQQGIDDAAAADAKAQGAVDFNETVGTLISDAVSALETQLLAGVAADGDTLAKLHGLIRNLEKFVISNGSAITSNVTDIAKLANELSSINTLLGSDDMNLDTLQEIVDFIKDNEDTLSNLTIDGVAGLGDYLNGIDSSIANITSQLTGFVKYESSNTQTINSDVQIGAGITPIITLNGTPALFDPSDGIVNATGFIGDDDLRNTVLATPIELIEASTGKVVHSSTIASVNGNELYISDPFTLKVGERYYINMLTSQAKDLVVTGEVTSNDGNHTLSLKANQVDVDTALHTKVERSEFDGLMTSMQAELATKLDSAEVDNVVREYTVTGAGTQNGNFYEYDVTIESGFRVAAYTAEIDGSQFSTAVSYNLERTAFTLKMPMQLNANEVTFAVTLKPVIVTKSSKG